MPGVGVSVASSTIPNHTMGALEDAFTTMGHTGFRRDAQILAAVLYHYLINAPFRAAVVTEHASRKGLFRSIRATCTRRTPRSSAPKR